MTHFTYWLDGDSEADAVTVESPSLWDLAERLSCDLPDHWQQDIDHATKVWVRAENKPARLYVWRSEAEVVHELRLHLSPDEIAAMRGRLAPPQEPPA